MIYRYAHPEIFSKWEKPDLTPYSGKLILYGAGRRGRVAAHCLAKSGIEFICFCDSNPQKWGGAICGYKIISPEELYEKHKNTPILVTTQHWASINSELKERQFTSVFNCVGLFLNIDFGGFDENGFNDGYSPEYMSRNTDRYFESLRDYDDEGSESLDAAAVWITSRCNLRCRECSGYMAYYSNPRDYDLSKTIMSVDRLLAAFTGIARVELLGGETFLYKNLATLLRELAKKPRLENLFAITNGTLLPGAETLDAMRHPKITIRISDYGDLSRNKDKLIDILKTNNINYELTNHKTWFLSPRIASLNETEDELRYKVKYCLSRCRELTVREGKIFGCSAINSFYNLKALPEFEDAYVDLLSDLSGDELRKAVKGLLVKCHSDQFFQACRHCEVDVFSDCMPIAAQATELLKFPKVF